MSNIPVERCSNCFQKNFLQTQKLVNPTQESVILKTSEHSPAYLVNKILSANINRKLKYGSCDSCPFLDYSQ